MEPVIIENLQAHIALAELRRWRGLMPDESPAAAALDQAIAEATKPAKTELTTLDDAAKSFVANGVKYVVHSSLSIERYTMFEEFGLVFGTGSPFKQVFDTLLNAMKMLNAHPVRLADLSILLNKTLTNVAHLENKETYALQMCTLFVNREGEDIGTWSPETAFAKIADWKAEGIDARFFLRLSAVLVPGFIDAYQLLTPAIGAAQTAMTGQPLNLNDEASTNA
jgi:hypothetical protein